MDLKVKFKIKYIRLQYQMKANGLILIQDLHKLLKNLYIFMVKILNTFSIII